MGEKAQNTDSGINNETVSPEPTKPKIGRPADAERTQQLMVYVTTFEEEYLKDIASLLSKIDINGAKILHANDMSELIRTCLTYTCSTYQMNVFPDSSLVTRLPSKDAVKEFMAFRKKYMNYPLDAQLQELKRMGIVKQKKQA